MPSRNPHARLPLVMVGVFASVAAVAFSQTADVPRMPPTDFAVGRPKAFVDERVISKGRVREGDVVEATFVVQNRGDQNLLIGQVQSTCACTVAELGPEQKTVKPGESVPIKVTFSSKGYPGAQTKTIHVLSNDPDEPQLPLTVTVYVDSVFRLIPPVQLDFRSVRRGETAARGADVVPADENGVLELISVSTGSTSITYTAEPLTQGTRKGYRINFSVTPEAPVGEINADAHIVGRVGQETADQVLKLRGEVVGDLGVRPIIVYSPQPTLPGNALKEVRVFSPAKAVFKILSADAGPVVEAKVSPSKEPGEFQIILTVRPDAPAGPFGAFLTVRTDQPEQALMRVPIYGNVAPRIAFEPLMVMLGSDSDAHRTRRVKLEAGDLTPFAITAVAVDPPICRAEVVPPAPGQTAYVQYVALTLDAAAASQAHEAILVVKTNRPDVAEVRVPVVIQTTGAASESRRGDKTR
jgi:hypothetical protein